MSRDDDLMADRISTPSLLRSDPHEEMYVTRPGAVRVPGPLSDQYLDSAVLASTPVSSRVISGEADDSVENLVVTDAVVVNDVDDDELVDPQEHAGGAGEKILAMGLTDVVLAEPMDPNHNGCQVLFRNPFVSCRDRCFRC